MAKRWRKRRHMRELPRNELQALIGAMLAKLGGPDHKMSLSYLIASIRDQDIAFPTRSAWAEDKFKELGFRLERDRNEWGSILRTYVTV